MVVIHIEPSSIYVILVCFHACVLGIALFLVGVPLQSWLCEVASNEGYNLIYNWPPSIIGRICLNDQDLTVIGVMQCAALDYCLLDVLHILIIFSSYRHHYTIVIPSACHHHIIIIIIPSSYYHHHTQSVYHHHTISISSSFHHHLIITSTQVQINIT